jgi:hypothetical protein
MNPASLIPAPAVIPVHWAWIDILLVLTFAVHILFMNTVFGGGVIALLNARGKGEPIARDLSRLLPSQLALTINFGVAPLLFLQVNYGHFDYPGSVIMGGWWLAVIATVLMAYYGLYIYDFKYPSPPTATPLPLMAALLMLLYTGFMFSNNMTIMLRPEAWLQYFSSENGMGLNLSDPTLYPRFLHFMTGALAVGGLFLALVGRKRNKEQLSETGMRWLTRATMVNLGFGLWFLISLPQDIMLQFMGGHGLATATLMTGIALAGAVIWAGAKKMVLPAAIITVLTVLVMAVSRHFVRMFFLAPHFTVQDIPIVPDYSPLIMFLISLVVVLAICVWMIATFRKAEGRA